MADTITKKIDISEFDKIKDLIFEYFYLFSELLEDDTIDIKEIKLDIDSDNVVIIGEKIRENSDEESESSSDDWI
jgi:hypothetical protein